MKVRTASVCLSTRNWENFPSHRDQSDEIGFGCRLTAPNASALGNSFGNSRQWYPSGQSVLPARKQRVGVAADVDFPACKPRCEAGVLSLSTNRE